jgi:hypothetical protein
MTHTFSPDLAPKSRNDELADRFDSLASDYLIAIGALSAVENNPVIAELVGRMQASRPLLAALFGLAHAHTDELVAIIEKSEAT